MTDADLDALLAVARAGERHGHPPDWAVAMVELRPERVFSHGPPGA